MASETYSVERVNKLSEPALTLLSFDSIDSTQLWAERNLQVLVDDYGLSAERWVGVTAKSQCEGVGTRNTTSMENRRWFSPEGNVYVTFVIPWPESQKAKLQSFAQVGTFAVSRTLESFGLVTQIKWVNDVMVSDQKIAGVLCANPSFPASLFQEGQHAEAHIPLLVGIGINVEVAGDPSLGNTATSVVDAKSAQEECMLKERHGSVSFVEEVSQVLIREVFNAFKQLKSDGFSPFHDYITRRLLWLGQEVDVDQDNQIHRGRFVGLTTDGALELEKSSPPSQEVFFSGHLRKVVFI